MLYSIVSPLKGAGKMGSFRRPRRKRLGYGKKTHGTESVPWLPRWNVSTRQRKWWVDGRLGGRSITVAARIGERRNPKFFRDTTLGVKVEGGQFLQRTGNPPNRPVRSLRLFFEERIPLLAGIFGRRARLAHQVNAGAGLKIVAVVGLVF